MKKSPPPPLPHLMENVAGDRGNLQRNCGDSPPFDFEPNGSPFGSKSKENLSPRSYTTQLERKWKYSYFSVHSEKQIQISSHDWTEHDRNDCDPFAFELNGISLGSINNWKAVKRIALRPTQNETETRISAGPTQPDLGLQFLFDPKAN